MKFKLTEDYAVSDIVSLANDYGVLEKGTEISIPAEVVEDEPKTELCKCGHKKSNHTGCTIMSSEFHGGACPCTKYEPAGERSCATCGGRGFIYTSKRTVESIQAQEECPTEPCPQCNPNGQPVPKVETPKLEAKDLMPLLREILHYIDGLEQGTADYQVPEDELEKLEKKG